MKKPVTFIIAIAAGLALTACGGAVSSPSQEVSEPAQAETDTAQTDNEPAEEDSEPVGTEPEKEAPESEQAPLDYAQAYLDKAVELNNAGTADLFALVDVDGDVPELVAADSEGSYNDEGNVFLYTFPDNGVVEIMHVTEGLDGSHMYISPGNNMILETGSMMGNESYRICTVKAGVLDMTKELQALYDTENDSYTYRDGDKDITEKQYLDEFAKAISDNNPLTALDHDGLHEINITIKDGIVDFEEISVQNYMSLDEIKDKLVALESEPADMDDGPEADLMDYYGHNVDELMALLPTLEIMSDEGYHEKDGAVYIDKEEEFDGRLSGPEFDVDHDHNIVGITYSGRRFAVAGLSAAMTIDEAIESIKQDGWTFSEVGFAHGTAQYVASYTKGDMILTIVSTDEGEFGKNEESDLTGSVETVSVSKK